MTELRQKGRRFQRAGGRDTQRTHRCAKVLGHKTLGMFKIPREAKGKKVRLRRLKGEAGLSRGPWDASLLAEWPVPDRKL